MYKSSFVESQSFFNQYIRQQAQNRKKEQSGVVQCQRCLKYGHYTYECKNDVTYVYRPSRTMQFKEKHLRQELNNEKPPDAPQAWDGDRNRTIYVRREDDDLSVQSSESSIKVQDSVSSDVSSSSEDSQSSQLTSSNDSSSESNKKKTKKQKLQLQKEKELQKQREEKEKQGREQAKRAILKGKKREMKPEKPTQLQKKNDDKKKSAESKKRERSRSRQKKKK